MTGVHEDLCKNTCFSFSHRNSLEKLRRKFPFNHDAFALFLLELSLFPKELHTFSKTSHVRIKIHVAIFTKVSFFPKELRIFLKVSQASIKINFINLEKLYQIRQTLSNLINFIKLDKVYQA